MTDRIKPVPRRSRHAVDARPRGRALLLAGGVLLGCSFGGVAAMADPLDEYLDRAERAMQDSADSLRGKQSDQSVNHQSSAIRELERYLSTELQQDQQELRKRLQELKKKLAERGIDMDKGGQKDGQKDGQQPGDQADSGDQDGDGNSFDQADSSMGDAGDQLGEGNAEGAAGSQGKALDALQKGLNAMANAQQGDGDQPGDGPGNQPGRDSRKAWKTDPLGRPMPSRDIDDLSQKIPGEIDVQRVRRILEELRRRSADPSRPQIELEYIERLLKDN
ncbi:hypothetical protein SSBR45G_73830 [Bradyrhizobium sp. SSBR45G]|uniref:DUF4175 family protein n=1 Tax=unclassified Bradyrhizobium TaxID=2631580 RepID=UPI0023429BCD|nr:MULTISPECIES: DUF4175 family protein [unclassified Bradyrhizobium]GLH82474.1 hypothetical protein SSBR45G_73830 [Bradyrhizobium sp. SSBR45G]GLH89907.1 hypothetical protein SSBR45R_73680 [Bradyrhizobium sp. SSBR45R]